MRSFTRRIITEEYANCHTKCKGHADGFRRNQRTPAEVRRENARAADVDHHQRHASIAVTCRKTPVIRWGRLRFAFAEAFLLAYCS